MLLRVGCGGYDAFSIQSAHSIAIADDRCLCTLHAVPFSTNSTCQIRPSIDQSSEYRATGLGNYIVCWWVSIRTATYSPCVLLPNDPNPPVDITLVTASHHDGFRADTMSRYTSRLVPLVCGLLSLHQGSFINLYYTKKVTDQTQFAFS